MEGFAGAAPLTRSSFIFTVIIFTVRLQSVNHTVTLTPRLWAETCQLIYLITIIEYKYDISFSLTFCHCPACLPLILQLFFRFFSLFQIPAVAIVDA